MRTILPLAIVFALILGLDSVQAQTQTWIWTDENGNVRFADDYSNIPEKYKKVAVPGPKRTKEQEDALKKRIEQKRLERDKKREAEREATVQKLSPALQAPQFQVIGRYDRSLSILVPQHTTNEHLKALIFEFRTARKSNTLSKIVPATTRGDQLGDYAVITVLVFSEPEWATSDRLKRFIKSIGPEDDKFYREYVKHIKAEYSYIALISSERGTLGYYDGITRSSYYEELWKDEFMREIEERYKKIHQ